MDYLVLRWNPYQRAYTVMQGRFETYDDAEEFAAERHKQAEESARAEGGYASTPYRFVPISAERAKIAIGPGGRRILG